MSKCCDPLFWWGRDLRIFSSVLDLLEFVGVLALILLNAFYLLDSQQMHCYLSGVTGLSDLTVCYSVFWATVIAAVIGVTIAIGQICMCCMTSVGVFLELFGNAALSAWWLLIAAYWNYHGQAANELGFPNQGPRTAVMIIPYVIGASYVLSTIISCGRLVSYCCCYDQGPAAKASRKGKEPKGKEPATV